MTYYTNLFLEEVLDKNRLELLKNFKKIKELWFFLAWGTALALIFWHRKSIDFDFFCFEDFNNNELFQKISKIFWDKLIKKTFEEKNTLYIEANWIKISFFTYKYSLIWEKIESEFFSIYSLEDISAMKLWAIQNRATNKDYIDIYFLIKKFWLEELLIFFEKKFWNIVSKSILRKSLVYFEDIIDEELIILSHNLTFEKIKKSLEKTVLENNF